MKEVSSKAQLTLCSLNHFTVDSYSAMLNPLLPLIMTTFSLSQGATAFISASLGVIAAFVQPFGAALGVKIGEKRMQVASVLLSAIFIPLMGSTKSLFLLISFLILGKIGNAFFHPNAAAFVGKIGFQKSNTAMSLFSIGGTLAGAVTPIFIVWYVKLFGMKSMYLLALYGIFIAFLSVVYLPKYKESSDNVNQEKGFGLRDSLSIKGVKGLMMVIILRSLTLLMFSNLIPLYLKQLNYSLVWGGYFLTLATLAGTFGNYFGAILSDKFGSKKVNIFSLFLAFPFGFIMFLTTNVYLMLAMYISMSFFSFFTMASNISYMQKFLPHRKGIASSLSMGISWGTSSLLFVGMSLTINSIGLKPVLFAGAFSLLLAAIFSLKLPGPQIERNM
jgi:FSR family fosmidomycin resistance protein-like MFS transporter